MKLKTLLFLLLAMLTSTTLHAYDAEIDGIYYNFSGNNATVTKGDIKYSGAVVIPESVIYEDNTYSVTSIGGSAFYNCSSLTSVTIPNGVTSIEVSTFSGCSSLTSVNIPSSVTSIGRNAFSGCSSLVTVILESNEIVSKKRRLRTIFGDQVQNYVIGETVETIGDEAFEGCSGLTSITIPNSVTRIGGDAFSGCGGLTSATIGNGLTDGFDFSVFNYCSNLQTITLNCPEIYFYAAEGLTSLSEIILGKDVASVYAYSPGFESLASVKVEEGNTVYDSRDNCNAIIETATNTLIAGCKNTVIPQSITSIGGYAFSGCTGLASITIPDNVTSIGDYAFQGCI